MADRSIVSVHFNQLPETIQTDITTALGGEDLNPPESSSSPEKGVNVVKTYRPPSSAVSQQPPRPAVDAIEAQQRQREQAFKTIALDMIKNRVFQYYRYEHRLGSNNVLVLRDTMAFDRIDSNRNYQFDTWQMTIRGKVGVEFYDSRRREYRRILAVFAATAEEDTNREVRISHFRHIKQN
jgi:hypothetical protein